MGEREEMIKQTLERKEGMELRVLIKKTVK